MNIPFHRHKLTEEEQTLAYDGSVQLRELQIYNGGGAPVYIRLDGGACDSNAETEDGSKTVEIPPDKTWTAVNEPFGKSVRSIRVKGEIGTVLQVKSVEV